MKMPTESRERKPAKSSTNAVVSSSSASHYPLPQRTEPLPCPRCHSTSTKFCYYNNYNLSQPRYFCKSCRRYWTHGGALRNVPVGGGTRKSSGSSKRQRSFPSSATATINSPSCNSTVTHESGTEPEAEPQLKPGNPFPVLGANELDLNESYNIPAAGGGRFSTLLNMQGPAGLLNLQVQGEYGLGLEEMGLGFGPARVWPYPPPEAGFFFAGGGSSGASVNGNGNDNSNAGGGGGAMEDCAVACNSNGINSNASTWPMGNVENVGVVDGDCYNWPGLVISTPGKSLEQ